MKCPNCGTNVPSGFLCCGECGTEMPTIPKNTENDTSDKDITKNSIVQDIKNKDDKDIKVEKRTAKPLNKKLIFCIFALLVLVVFLVALLLFGNKKNGIYESDIYASFGMEVLLEVHGDNFTLTMSYEGETQTQKGEIKFDGTTVTLTVDNDTLTGIYNESEQTITIPDLFMTFKKKK